KIMYHKIELHCHTLASDGDMSPQEIVTRAIERGYDAIAISDHNTTAYVSAVQRVASDLPLVIVPAIEWTTFWGHIVISGGNCDLDWRTITKENIEKCLEYATKCGDIATIAHPRRIGTPLCGGCYDHFDITDWSNVSAFEVWSNFCPNTYPTSLAAFDMWQKLLAQGVNLSAVYGYDWHCPDTLDIIPPFAYTFVNCANKIAQSDKDIFTAQDVLDGIKNHHTYVSMGIEIDCHLSLATTAISRNLNCATSKIDCSDTAIATTTYDIGDTISQAIYKISISTKVCKDYPARFCPVIKQLRIVNTFNSSAIDIKYDGSYCDFELKLSKGLTYFQLEGLFEGQESTLAISSAWNVV
ncbi:MAG: CehA/McbA family metallohydrolase, partial [Clostridia bacterium]